MLSFCAYTSEKNFLGLWAETSRTFRSRVYISPFRRCKDTAIFWGDERLRGFMGI